jgi:hypothetical protein
VVNEKTNHGYAVEDIIENLCSNTFFSEFTVRSPKYVKANGKEKEIADILIPFDDTLIAFQIKTKEEAKSIYERSGAETDRIKRKVEKVVNQFKTTKKAFDNDKINDLISVRGLPLPYDNNRISNFFGIAIIDIIEPVDSEDDRTGIYYPVVYINGIPVHVFMRDEFEILLNVVDTLPDFVKYISMRKNLKPKIAPITAELDILALYKLNPSLITEFIERKCDKLIITPDMWSEYEPTYHRLMDIKNKANPHFIIDHIIETLHKTVGYSPPIQFPSGSNINSGNQDENYLQIAHYLGHYDREERIEIGKQFFKKLKKADHVGFGYCFISNSTNTDGLVFYSTNDKRQERFDRLYQLSAAIYCMYELKEIIGITTQGLSSMTHSYDFLMFKGLSFSNSEELIKWGKNVFNLKEKLPNG